MPTATLDRRIARMLAVALLAAAGLRVVASVVSGFATWGADRGYLPERGQRVGGIVQAFGAGGDTIQALLLVAALALLLWQGLSAIAPAYRTSLAVLTVATVALVVCRVVGFVILTSEFSEGATAAQDSVVIGFGVADLVVCGALLVGLRSSQEADDATFVSGDEPVLFAVDRKTADIWAFMSAAEARRGISVYSIEDDEFTFYDDEGRLVTAEVVEGTTAFTPSEVEREEELLAALKRFAADKGLSVADRDDPLSYVQPIKEWQRRRT